MHDVEHRLVWWEKPHRRLALSVLWPEVQRGRDADALRPPTPEQDGVSMLERGGLHRGGHVSLY